MSQWRHRAVTGVTVAAMMLCGGAAASVAQADETKPTQTLSVNYAEDTGDFLGGASGTLYGLGDAGSPTDAILDGARVENSSQKPPTGTQHPSGDALALEDQFFANGGNELAVYMQDYYPDWSYNGGQRPGDDRSYVLDVPVTDPSYGTYTEGGNGTWDYAEITEIVVNKILANTKHPDNYTFIPFNEPDGGNWYNTGDDAGNPLFAETFLDDWDAEYRLVQEIWNQYKNGEKENVYGVKPTADHAVIAGPGDTGWRQNRSDAFLAHTKETGTLPDVFVWHELGKDSLKSYRNHYNAYRELERKHGIDPLRINITEYGELRDMGVPGQLIQWMSMFEDTKVQAETAYWNYAGNLSDNMARANSANAGWWQFKWYGDLRGTRTVKVTSEHPDSIDNLQGIAAIDTANRKATVLYGGANDANADAVQNTGANIPVKVHLTGLDAVGLDGLVDVEVRENAFTGPDGVAATPRVVNAMSGVQVENGTLDVTTVSVDRYASYQLVITPHQDRTLSVDDAEAGRWVQAVEAEDTELGGGAQSYSKTPMTGGWSDFITSGNGDVGNFKTGGTATWTVDVPVDGTYRFQIISGNVGFTGTNGVAVNGEKVGDLQLGAELAMKGAAKWLYRGSGEIELQLTAGTHSIQLQGSSMDNTLDKFLLYQVSGADGEDAVTYPASQFRLSDGAGLVYENDGTNGFADLNGGSAEVFAHVWNAGYQDVTVTYNAPQGATIAMSVNGMEVAALTAESDGLQSSTVKVAMAEGINQVTLTAGAGVRVRDVRTARDIQENDAAITVEAEDMTLGGGAQVVSNDSSNASGKGWVTGLGNQFETQETGAEGMGDRTRVVVIDSNNTPSVVTDNKGTLTIPAGTVPAGTYNAVVSFSNDAFIGRHDYNPQIVDLGLQVRSGSANGEELARGAFRYTYSDSSFLNRSLEFTTDGSALVLGNWDPAGSGAGAVSWGVAPQVDRITFYPVVSGAVTHAADAGALTSIEVTAEPSTVQIGAWPQLDVVAKYGDGVDPKTLSADQYTVDGFDPNTLGEQTLTVSYSEGRVTRAAEVKVEVAEAAAPVDTSKLDEAIASAEGLNADDYTAESFKAVQDALAAAKDALGSQSQSDIDQAANNLNDAIKALVRKEAAGTDAGHSTKPSLSNTGAAVGAALAALAVCLVGGMAMLRSRRRR